MDISSPIVSSLYNSIYHGLGTGYPYLILSIILYFIALSVFLSVFAYLFGWIERKFIARIQSRHGPTYVGKYGILQNFADLVKLLSKESITPEKAHKILYRLALPSLIAVFILVVALIPITSGFVALNSSISLLIIVSLITLSPLLIMIAGWSSGNRFGSISAQRSVVMLIAYEIPLLLVIASVGLIAHSYSISSIVSFQASHWLLLLDPIGFILFFIIMLAELERPPFDLREADSELIAGWLTDVDAPYYALALLLDYMRVFALSLLITVIFLGGWLGPAVLPAIIWLLVKVLLIALFTIFLRATTMRMRLDRLLRLGWQYLMPIAVANIAIVFLIFGK
jgi:NADH-quinone oxidoreductase subunit H